jgi:pimeloyl-ACP methyl ester carboxylesterase
MHVVWSEEDKVNPAAAEKIQAMIQEGSVTAPFSYRVLSGSGHYIQHEKPNELVEEMLKFCNELRKD